MEHTQECLAYQVKLKTQYDEWIAKWPNYCPACGGSGLLTWTENGAPHGAGFWAMPMSDVCQDCTEQCKCPRCGQFGLTDESKGDTESGMGPCKFCGWNYDDACPLEAIDGPCACEEAEWWNDWAEDKDNSDPFAAEDWNEIMRAKHGYLPSDLAM